ncbi:transposase [Polyangium sorediatum]|uniref:transposase n=1 Tax=Polyangium sorediatum TaxID=889274 RepID=UPI0010BE0598
MGIDERPSRQGYPSDLADAEGYLIAELLPPPIWILHLQEPKFHPREIMNAVRYCTRTGCSQRQLPHDFPPLSIYQWCRRWTNVSTTGSDV